MGKSGAVKAVSMMMAITLFGKALGLIRDIFVVSYYGTASIEGAAFNYASVLPRNFFDVMFASAISASFIPVFNETLEREGREKAFELSHRFISIILTLSVIITIICVIWARPIVTLYDGGKNPAAISLASQLIRVMFPIIVISGLAFSLTGVLQSMGEFNIPAAMAASANLVILIYFFTGMRRFGVYGLCAAYLLGWTTQLIIQIPFLWKRNFHFRYRPQWRDAGIQKIARLTLPVMVSTWVAPVNMLVNGKAALQDTAGIEAFNAIIYANTLYSVITGVFVLSISNVIFPRLSVLAAHDDGEGFSETLRQTIRTLFFFLIPMSLGLMVVSRPLVRLVYERNQFNALSTALTATAMIFFSVGIPGFGLQTILTRGFYAYKDGKTPMITGIAAIAANLALSFALVPRLGVGGPALANSLSISLISLIMLVRMNRKVQGLISRAFWLDLGKMLAAGFAMTGAALFLRDWMTKALPDILAARLCILGAPVIVGAGIYIGASILFKLPEADILTAMIKKLSGRRGEAS